MAASFAGRTQRSGVRRIDVIVPLTPPRPPSLTLLYHVEKAGGTSLKEYLKRNALGSKQLHRRLSGVVEYPFALCFLEAQFGGGLLPTLPNRSGARRACRPRESPARCRPCVHAADPSWLTCADPASDDCRSKLTPAPPDLWRTSQLAIEFHSDAKALYLEHMLPRLAALRDAYAALGGTVLTMALLREPVSQLFSAFRMWPPASYKVPIPNRTLATPFPVWAERAAGAQVGLLSCHRPTVAPWQRARCRGMNTVFNPPDSGMHNDNGGCAPLQEARATLASFDLVAPTECVSLFYPLLEQRLRLEPDDDAHARLRTRIPPVRPYSPLRGSKLEQQAMAWSWETLNATARQRLTEITACDAELFGDVVARARQLRDGGAALRGPRTEACAKRLAGAVP